MRGISLALVIALVGCASEAAHADGDTGLVYGRVLIQGTGQPVCPITVRAVSNREPTWETQTQADGSFRFLALFPGNVTIIIGQNRIVQALTVHANLMERSTFYLNPLPWRYHTPTGVAAPVCTNSSYQGYVFTDYDPYSAWLNENHR
jgi:hypothetical protein